MLHKNAIKNSFYLLISSAFIELSRLFKISFMIGSKFSFFSAVNIVAPMAGIFGGNISSLSLFVLHSLYKWIIIGGSIFSLIGYHIPHFFASFYWNTDSKLAKNIIPLICMIAFISHPVGLNAFAYAMLWFIPIAITTFNKNNIFLKALGSTFTAHAVGSVLWIYSVPMAAESWISLIPIAICERIVFALGMVTIYYAYNFIKSKFNLKSSEKNIISIFGKNY